MSEQPDAWGEVGRVVGEDVGGAAGVLGTEAIGLGPEDLPADAAAVAAGIGGWDAGGNVGEQFGETAEDLWKDVTGS